MNILFWNLGKKKNADLLSECMMERDVDIAVLAEHRNLDRDRMAELLPNYLIQEGNGGCEKLVLYVKDEVCVSVRREQSRYTVNQVSFHNENFILCGVHLQDRRSDPHSVARLFSIRETVQSLRSVESETGIENAIVIGDFNANPYDKELLQTDAFNATLFKDVILANEHRTWQGNSYRLMYNPILNWLSESPRNYGSFYYSDGPLTSYWHCLDQVIVTKGLIDRIESLQYLRSIGEASLIADIAPSKSISDHLPLLVSVLTEGVR